MSGWLARRAPHTCEIPSGSAWNTGQRPAGRGSRTAVRGCRPDRGTSELFSTGDGQRCVVCRICHRPCGVSHLGVREFETPTCPTKSVFAGDLGINDQPNRGLRADTAAGRHACASAAPCGYPPPVEATSPLPSACRDPHACTAPAAATPTTAPLFSRACSQADSARAIYRRGQCRTRSSLQVR